VCRGIKTAQEKKPHSPGAGGFIGRLQRKLSRLGLESSFKYLDRFARQRPNNNLRMETLLKAALKGSKVVSKTSFPKTQTIPYI
jgi:hypothetical protein